MSKYILKLRVDFPAASRHRAGILVPAGKGVEVELTAAQVEAIKADPEISMKEVKEDKPAEPKAPAAKPDSRQMVDDKQNEKHA